MMLKAGIEGEAALTVKNSDTAAAVGSGDLAVFATPAMAALMEKTAMESIAPFLDEGATTVGTSLDIKHTAATPVGMTVRCKSTLTAVDGRRLCFALEVFDECGPVGGGTHERFIVLGAPFQAKADGKLTKERADK